MVLAHAKDAYLYGYLDTASAALTNYLTLLENFRNTPEWTNSLSEQWRCEFEQIYNEMAALLPGIAGNLDYFGNPPGWVPMLSFEANKAAFENETERAIRVLYLEYWIKHAATTIQQKVDALTSGRQKLKDEIEQYKTDYDAVLELIPALETQSITISNQIAYLQVELQSLEQRLKDQAQNNVAKRNEVEQTCKLLGGVLKIFPLGQPLLGKIGAGLDVPLEDQPANGVGHDQGLV